MHLFTRDKYFVFFLFLFITGFSFKIISNSINLCRKFIFIRDKNTFREYIHFVFVSQNIYYKFEAGGCAQSEFVVRKMCVVTKLIDSKNGRKPVLLKVRVFS